MHYTHQDRLNFQTDGLTYLRVYEFECALGGSNVVKTSRLKGFLCKNECKNAAAVASIRPFFSFLFFYTNDPLEWCIRNTQTYTLS